MIALVRLLGIFLVQFARVLQLGIVIGIALSGRGGKMSPRTA